MPDTERKAATEAMAAKIDLQKLLGELLYRKLYARAWIENWPELFGQMTAEERNALSLEEVSKRISDHAIYGTGTSKYNGVLGRIAAQPEDREDPIAESRRAADRAGVALEVSPLPGFAEARADGGTHLVFNLSNIGRGYAVSLIPDDMEFERYVVKDGFADVDAAERWIYDNVEGARGWTDIHVFEFI